MDFYTSSGCQYFVLPENARCRINGEHPEKIKKCPICNFDDFGDICIPEICDEYEEVSVETVIEEMQKLRAALDAKGIEWVDASDMDKLEICRTHFSVNGGYWSVVNGLGTYGGWNRLDQNNPGLLEVMDPEGEVTGWLTAEEVMKMVKESYM